MSGEAVEGCGARLRELRKALGLTQEALAGAVGVSQPSLHAWEKGAHPTYDNRRRLAAVLGTDPYAIEVAPTGEAVA